MAQSSTTSGTSSRRYIREHDMPSSSRYVDSEWESKEALRQRELEETRARAAQMEKTMRWWSDCTANWREKWSKVRNERNMAREEVKVLRAKLEIAVKDANTFKHESQELELQNDQLKKEMEKIHVILLKHYGQFDQQIFTVLESDPQLRATFGLDEQLDFYNNIGASDMLSTQEDLVSCKNLHETSGSVTSGSHNILPGRDIEEYVLQGAVPKHAVEFYEESPNNSLSKTIPKLIADNGVMNNTLQEELDTLDVYNEECLKQKISVLQLNLEEATKAISIEREEKSSLNHTTEQLRVEIKKLKEQCEELQKSKADATRELLELKERFQIELSDAQSDLMDEMVNVKSVDPRLSEYRVELEKLQTENAAEWSRRERSETEKISLERENKQLRLKIQDLQEEIESRRSRPVSTDANTRQLQQELTVRNMVLLEVKQYQTTLKQSLTGKTVELSHAMRRCEQYEIEVKRVRARVEELKKELAAAQDDVDFASNNVRRLQRINQDLMQELDSANVQLEHYKKSNSESCTADAEIKEVGEEKLHANNSNESATVCDGQV